MTSDKRMAHWASNLRLLANLLFICLAGSLGCGILLIDPLNAIKVAGYPLGFWFAQQGAIYVFVVIAFVYAIGMGWIDRKNGLRED